MSTKPRRTQIQSEDGWIPAEETWTYASASTFTISGDKTGKYRKGDRIKLTNSTVKYFYITAVAYSAPNTTVTITGGSDYSLADAAITANYYNNNGGGFGFPASHNYTPTIVGGFTSNPTLTFKFFIANGICTIIGTIAVPGTWNGSAAYVTTPVQSATIVYAPSLLLNNGGYAVGVFSVNGSDMNLRIRTGVLADPTNASQAGIYPFISYPI